MIDSDALAKECADLALDKKAMNIVLLDLREASSFTDYFVIMSGTSEPHVKTLAEHIDRTMRKGGNKPSNVEGFQDGRWALIDLGDVVVHIFQDHLRDYYDLENLWKDAPRTVVKEQAS